MRSSGFKRSRALWDNARRPHENKGRQLAAYTRAILYELQPVQFASFDSKEWIRNIRFFLSTCLKVLKATPGLLTELRETLRTIRLSKLGFGASALITYYYFVRWAHEKLDAGPMVLILTALVAIFTIGLDDDPNRDGLSAYSVFNRGFQRILGSLDADELVAQHVGGGLGFMGGAVDAARAPEEQEWDDPRPARHREQRADPPPAEPDEQGHNNTDNRSRRSGKKARRQNLEQRQEIRRQREAAMAMGFGDDDDEAAMMQLVEQEE